MALEFNQKSFVQNVFTTALGSYEHEEKMLVIENSNITLVAMKKGIEKYNGK